MLDLDKVFEGGPWTFRGNPIHLAPYNGFTKTSTIELNTFKIWIQIHDSRDGYNSMVKSLASKVGEHVAAETSLSKFFRKFYCARVRIDVRKPLKTMFGWSETAIVIFSSEI